MQNLKGGVELRNKIAIIEPVGGHGGMNYYDFSLAKGVVNAGCEVILYTCVETIPPEKSVFLFVHGFHGIYGNAPKWLRGLRYVRDLLFCLKDAKRRGCNIVHFHFFHAGPIEALTMHLARAYGLKIILTVHDVESFSGASNHASAKKIFGSADRLIVHNFVSRNEIVNVLGIDSSRIDIVQHGNYLGFIDNVPSRKYARNKFGLSDEFVLLFFGQIKQVKGLDILLEALAVTKPYKNKFILLIAGKVWKDDFNKYLEQIERLGLDNVVRTDIRYIPDSEASIYYSAADLVVLPYRRIYQSGVLLMAMSYQRAVLASNLPGMVEVVRDGENGFLFESENVYSLAERLADIIEDPGAVDGVAQSGYQTVCVDHDWDLIGRMTCNAYAKV